MARFIKILILALVATLTTASNAAAFTPKTALRADRQFSLHRVGANAPYLSETPRQISLGYGQVASDSPLAAKGLPQLGSKLEYFLGRATGSAHNIQRSAQMLSQLERIGLSDNPATRQYLTEHLARALSDPSNITRVEAGGRVVRESLLMGPKGGLKFETIWEGTKLITGNFFGGP